MNISRYIYIPLIFGILYYLIFLFMSGDFLVSTSGFFLGSLLGFGISLYNNYKVKKVSADNNKEAYNVHPKQSKIVFTNYDKTFDLCLESVENLKEAKVKRRDKSEGIIVIKTNMNWHVFGNKITCRIRKLTDISTEVEIQSDPIPRTALLDYGEGYRTVKDIVKFLDDKNQEMSVKHLNEQKDIPDNFHVNSKSNKEKIPIK